MFRPLLRLLPATVLLLAGVAASPRSAAAQDMTEIGVTLPLQDAPPVPAPLQEIYRQLATYWEQENARGIAQFVRGGRIYVVVQRAGVGERLAGGQLRYLLEELFDKAVEVSFRFPATAAYDPAAGTGYAIGERVYQEPPGVEARIDRVFVGARSERGRWMLTELRLTVR
ncbi:MAG: hypothetical protein ABR559_09425 [Gemmatimonadota bacterium]|nr:hypothetical protein [Novosphingobium sp.]